MGPHEGRAGMRASEETDYLLLIMGVSKNFKKTEKNQSHHFGKLVF